MFVDILKYIRGTQQTNVCNIKSKHHKMQGHEKIEWISFDGVAFVCPDIPEIQILFKTPNNSFNIDIRTINNMFILKWRNYIRVQTALTNPSLPTQAWVLGEILSWKLVNLTIKKSTSYNENTIMLAIYKIHSVSCPLNLR